MTWRPSCACFVAAVTLAKRIHALEPARAQARIHYDSTMVMAGTTFQIRGLAKNGKDFAPGGKVTLVGWLSDPTPAQKEIEHFCAWIRTADSLGVPGYPVTYVVHFSGNAQTYHAGPTNKRGVACSQKSIGTSPVGKRVLVDIYAAGQHVTASFQPRTP